MSWPAFNGWLQEGAAVAIPIAQALAILLGAWLLLRVLRLVVRRICDSYHLPAQVAVCDQEGRYLYLNAAGSMDTAERAWLIGKSDVDYCRARGIRPDVARRLLVSAFVHEILDRMELKPVRETLSALVAERLAEV